MPFHEENPILLPIEHIDTDEEAQRRLPPYGIATQTYADCRAEGLLPCEALQQTLDVWREFQAYARPPGYGTVLLPTENRP